MPFYGDFLVQLGVVRQEQLGAALAEQSGGRLRLGELAVRAGLLDLDQVAQARRIQRDLSGELADGRLGEIIVALGFAGAEQVEALYVQQRADWRKVGQILVEQGAIGSDAHESYLRDFLYLEQSRRRRLDASMEGALHPLVVSTFVQVARSILPRFGLADCKVTDVRDASRVRPDLPWICRRELHGAVDVTLALSTTQRVALNLKPDSDLPELGDAQQQAQAALDSLTQALTDVARARLPKLDSQPTSGDAQRPQPDADLAQIELLHGVLLSDGGQGTPAHTLMTLITCVPD